VKRANAVTNLPAMLFWPTVVLFTGSAHAEISNNAFQQNCSRCHSSAANFKTPPEKIMTLLQSGSVRQHRFSLDEQTMQNIIRYIQQQES